jgi:hypothetical protein
VEVEGEGEEEGVSCRKIYLFVFVQAYKRKMKK